MLVAAESIVGRYVWKQYDLLVLPPTFPYGGMENPCLTFVTPTLLVSEFFQNTITSYIFLKVIFIQEHKSLRNLKRKCCAYLTAKQLFY